jgi:hypothetical protein
LNRSASEFTNNQQIENIARESYPQVARLEQVKGVGTLIALILWALLRLSNFSIAFTTAVIAVLEVARRISSTHAFINARPLNADSPSSNDVIG